MDSIQIAAQKFELINRIVSLPETQFEKLYSMLNEVLTNQDFFVEELNTRREYDNEQREEKINSIISILSEENTEE
jgi:hypothetical protein